MGIYEVYGKYETRSDGEVVLEGANASAEEADEGTDSNSVSGIDVVLNHRLVEDFKKNISAAMKDLLGRFKDLQFFNGESMDPDAMICMVEYKEVDGSERPVLMFFKHGLEEEKC